MTEQQRLQRAHMLIIRHAAGSAPASAWCEVNPDTSDQSDAEMAEMYEREVEWLVQWLRKHPEFSLRDGPFGVPRSKWCIGVDGRPCGKKVPRRRKRCTACADEQIRLNRRGYNRTYFRTHREPLNAKRNERRSRQHQRERDAAAAVAEQKRGANRPEVTVDKRTGKLRIYDPRTGKDWIFGRHAKPKERAPRRPLPLGEQSLTQPDRLPKRRCKICVHPDRAVIDTALLQGVSLRTVAGRHGLSATALHRHRRRHVTEPTVGDILAPDNIGHFWREWDGTKWQRIASPRREHLKEVQGRPVDIRWRTGWNDYGITSSPCRKVYRRRRARTPSTASQALPRGRLRNN